MRSNYCLLCSEWLLPAAQCAHAVQVSAHVLNLAKFCLVKLTGHLAKHPVILIKCKEIWLISGRYFDHWKPRPRLPVTPIILFGLRQVWEKSRHGFDNIMLWAACTTCFFGFLRSGEITSPSAHDFDPTYHLTLADIAVDNPSHPLAISVYIKASKTDPFRKGVQLSWAKLMTTCAQLWQCWHMWPSVGRQPGPLFCLAHQRQICARGTKSSHCCWSGPIQVRWP